MMNPTIAIAGHMYQSLLHIWPYLLISVPTALALRLFDSTRYITRAFQQRPMIAIIAATLIGAVSPFCSCGVIPVIASLLLGGVPLAPVMSFWIASPSMDPEMFFLSVSMLGWELAVWRLLATLFLSLGAGFLTQYLVSRGLIRDCLRLSTRTINHAGLRETLASWWSRGKALAISSRTPIPAFAASSAKADTACCSGLISIDESVALGVNIHSPNLTALPMASDVVSANGGCSCGTSSPTGAHGATASKWSRLPKEAMGAIWMVTKFMALAFLIETLITLYVPAGWIERTLGRQSHGAILWSTLIGIPAYTSNLSALPMISGLLHKGMNPAAALAFLIAGPTTTLPAMAAVWGLVTKRVFVLYLAIVLVGSLLVGYLYLLTHLVM